METKAQVKGLAHMNGFQCWPYNSNIKVTWELIRNSDSQVNPHLLSQKLWRYVQNSVLQRQDWLTWDLMS